MRDLDKRPYSIDEKRVAEWWATKIGVGGGDDPIGCLIVSHECMAADRKYFKDLLHRFRDYAERKMRYPDARLDKIWKEIAEALDEDTIRAGTEPTEGLETGEPVLRRVRGR